MGRQLVKALKQAGFTMVSDASQADVIIAHSGGCYLVPEHNRARLIVQIGLAYWPGHIWLLSTVRKVAREISAARHEHRLGEWGRKWLYHMLYAFNLGPALRMARNHAATKPWNSPQRQIIVRNRHDVYCSPEVYKLAFRGPRAFISLPGEHDDCWDHPERYVSLLQSEL